MQMDAADFITVDKLDSAIEAALNSRYVNSFAVDLDGNRYIEQADGSTIVRPSSEQQQLPAGSWKTFAYKGPVAGASFKD